MKSLPLVSIIIPVYNVEVYLRECIDSVINQTYKNIEIIIVDDGSTDKSGKICDEYKEKDNRIIVIHKKNGGLSSARNAGLDAMHGEYVSFLDSDDAFSYDFIHIMVTSMINKTADIVMCGFYSCRTQGKMSIIDSYACNEPEEKIYTPNQVLCKMMTDKMNMFVWNKVYSSNIFDSLRFPEGYVYEDMILMPLIIEKANRILTISNSLVFYRKRKDSISVTINEENLFNWLYAIKMREEFVKNRIPSVFSVSLEKSMLQADFEYIMDHYVMLYSIKNFYSLEIKDIFKREIQKRRNYVLTCSMKWKALYCFIKISPHLCWKLKVFYRLIINRQKN